MRILVFDSVLSGHHLEYIHHIYLGAIQRPEIEYVFAVPENEWFQVKDNQEWPIANNISWIMLDDHLCKEICKGSLFVQSWKTSRFIKKIAVEHHVDKILLISIAPAIPFLPLILPKNIKLSGIIYKIYLRAPKKGLRGVIDKLRYSIMAHGRSIGKVFILNDPRSTDRLNSIYKTDRFVCLPDPVPNVSKNDLQNVRSELGVSENVKIFLHFGAMDERKGTLLILRTLYGMSESELSDKLFVFAGRVGDRIKNVFYELAKLAEKHGAKIHIKDEFVTYTELNNLCHTADCILIPYLLTDLSSGALGYAAVHNTPVIGPKEGLIGELISDNDLGVCLINVDMNNLHSAMLNIPQKSVGHMSNYSIINSSANFQVSILSEN